MIKRLLTLSILVALIITTQVTFGASLTNIGDSLSNLTPSKTAITHTIVFSSQTNISAPGELRINFGNFDLRNVAASADVDITGGGVTWKAIQDTNLNNFTNVLTLDWSSGTLTAGSPVTVKIDFVRNPSTTGNHTIILEVGEDNFIHAIDSKDLLTWVSEGEVSVAATVPFIETNPSITNINPEPTIIISQGSTQEISFLLTDLNNDSIDYTLTPSTGSISVSPLPATPVTNTSLGKTVTFTYFADGNIGAQTIIVTADDNEAIGGGLVTKTIEIFVI